MFSVKIIQIYFEDFEKFSFAVIDWTFRKEIFKPIVLVGGLLIMASFALIVISDYCGGKLKQKKIEKKKIDQIM